MSEWPHFAIVTRDEILSLDGRAVLESRLIHGTASQSGRTIEARDDLPGDLLTQCDRECERMRSALASLRQGRARAVVSVWRSGNDIGTSSTVSLSIADLSLVTSLPHLKADYQTLRRLAAVPPTEDCDGKSLPLLWRNGTAAVLLHEAAGHPSEHAQPAVPWPDWLSAVDQSEEGRADLLRSQTPLALRRQSFSDVPLRRMTRVVVGGVGGEAKRVPRRVEVLLLAGGRYEPLTDTVSLSIAAADLIDGTRSVRLRPFTLQDSRARFASSIRRGRGPVRRYPGVICTKEGQELFVGSHAPDLVTEMG